jgi:hypothetical protein
MTSQDHDRACLSLPLILLAVRLGATLKSSELKEEGLRICGDLLQPYGWRRLGRQTLFAKEEGSKIEKRFNLNCVLSNHPVLVRVTPYAEVIHADVEDMRKAIIGRCSYTINDQIQFLMKDPDAHLRWIYEDGGNTASITGRIVTDSLTYGTPYLEQFQTLGDITGALERFKDGQRSIMRQSLIICYCLEGRLDEAADMLRRDLEMAAGNPQDPLHEQVRKYVAIFGVPAPTG